MTTFSRNWYINCSINVNAQASRGRIYSKSTHFQLEISEELSADWLSASFLPPLANSNPSTYSLSLIFLLFLEKSFAFSSTHTCKHYYVWVSQSIIQYGVIEVVNDTVGIPADCRVPYDCRHICIYEFNLLENVTPAISYCHNVNIEAMFQT